MSGNEIEIVKDDDPYTVVFNALIFDNNLRLQTRMVLIMMTSVRPDWDFSIRGMAQIAHVTKDTMSKMLAELEAAGYVKRKKQPRGSSGQFAKAGYLVSRKPIFVPRTEHKNQDTDEPCPTSPYTNEPYTKNSPQLNTKQSTTEQLNSPYSPPEGDKPAPVDKPKPKARKKRQSKYIPDHKPERFEQFWECYPGGGARMRAVAAWDALAPDDALIDEMARALKRQMASRQWQDGVGIPYASTWLNQRRWTDKLPDVPQAQETGNGWAPDPEVPSC